MNNDKQSRGFSSALIKMVTLLVLGATGTLIPNWSALGQSVPPLPSTTQQQRIMPVLDEHMSELLSLKRLSVAPAEMVRMASFS